MLGKFVDTLICSESNQRAIEAAKNIKFNRHLIITAEVGMGKTQLLNAICRDLQNEFPKINLKLISIDEFSSGLIKSLKKHQYREYLDSFYDLDGLLIDDLDDCDNQPRTQQELCRLIKHFRERGAYLVISSSLPLSNLKNLAINCQAILNSFTVYSLGTIDRTIIENYVERLCQLSDLSEKKGLSELIQQKNPKSFYDLMSIYNSLR